MKRKLIQIYANEVIESSKNQHTYFCQMYDVTGELVVFDKKDDEKFFWTRMPYGLFFSNQNEEQKKRGLEILDRLASLGNDVSGCMVLFIGSNLCGLRIKFDTVDLDNKGGWYD